MIAPIEINVDDIISQYDVTEQQLGTMFDNIAKSLAMIYVAKLEKEMLEFFRKKQEERYLRIQNKISAFMLSLQKEENCELNIGYPNNIQPQILIKLL